MALVAVLDTNVLYSSLTRNVLLYHVQQDCFRAVWSDAILAELSRNLQAKAGCSTHQVEHLFSQLQKTFPEAAVKLNLELASSLRTDLPDPEDAHVIAVAVQSRASCIVTNNLKHFPKRALKHHEFEAITPDEFLLDLLDEDPTRSLTAVLESFRSLRKSRPSWPEYLARLHKVGLDKFAERLVLQKLSLDD